MGPSIMGSEDEVGQSLGRPCPPAGPSGLTNSPHPSSRLQHMRRGKRQVSDIPKRMRGQERCSVLAADNRLVGSSSPLSPTTQSHAAMKLRRLMGAALGPRTNPSTSSDDYTAVRNSVVSAARPSSSTSRSLHKDVGAIIRGERRVGSCHVFVTGSEQPRLDC
jgi:hypothetical protein